MASSPLAECPPLVIDFAHSDPTTGGGLQAGLLTMVSLGAQPMTVLTAVTIQDTAGISGILSLDAEWVEDQARALLEDAAVAVFRVGFLGSVDQVSAVAAVLSDYDDVPLVLWPPAIRLLHEDAIEDEVLAAIRDLLLPRTAVLVTGPGDAVRLLGDEDGDVDLGDSAMPLDGDGQPATGAATMLASRILDTGCSAVLLTGVAVAPGQRADLLFADAGLRHLRRWDASAAHLPEASETLAAAIAAGIACGEDLPEASDQAQDYVARAMAAGYRPGMGRILPDRFFWARPSLADAVSACGADDGR